MTPTQTLERPAPAPTPSPDRVVDTHAHLDDPAFDADREAVIRRAREAKVEVVLMSTDLASAERVWALARAHALVCAVGVHPQAAGQAGTHFEPALRCLAERPGVVAVGEIGLDYHRNYCPRDLQREVFRRQLALARERDLPVVIHNRQATSDVLAEVRQFPGLRGVFHCFLGTAAEAEELLELGFWLGLGGALTFKRNEELRKVVRCLPLSRLVLETDSPYLTPVPHRGHRNEPAHVRHVAERLAELRDLPLAAVAAQTTANARALFGQDL